MKNFKSYSFIVCVLMFSLSSFSTHAQGLFGNLNSLDDGDTIGYGYMGLLNDDGTMSEDWAGTDQYVSVAFSKTSSDGKETEIYGDGTASYNVYITYYCDPEKGCQYLKVRKEGEEDFSTIECPLDSRDAKVRDQLGKNLGTCKIEGEGTAENPYAFVFDGIIILWTTDGENYPDFEPEADGTVYTSQNPNGR